MSNENTVYYAIYSKTAEKIARERAYHNNNPYSDYAWHDAIYPRTPEAIKQSKIIGQYYNLVETNQPVKCTSVLRCSEYANIDEALKTVHKDSEFVGVVDEWLRHAYSDDME